MLKAGAVLPTNSDEDSSKKQIKNMIGSQNKIIGLAAASDDTIVSTSRTRNVTLSCMVRSIPDPEIEWAWNGYAIRNGSLSRVGSTVFTIDEWTTPTHKMSNLSILHADVEDHGGEYTCTGYNPAGHVTASIQLTMLKGKGNIALLVYSHILVILHSAHTT